MCCIYIKRLQNGTTCAVPLVGVQMGFTVREHTISADDDYVAGSGLNVNGCDLCGRRAEKFRGAVQMLLCHSRGVDK